jgi:hypothetical protein
MCRKSLNIPKNIPEPPIIPEPQRIHVFQRVRVVRATYLHPYIQPGFQMVANDTRCRSQLPGIMELTTAKIKTFEKYYPEYPFPSKETKNHSINFQIAQTRYWKSILAKHGGPFSDCLPNPETSLELTYPRLINLFYQETEEERIFNSRLWEHWSMYTNTFTGRVYRPGYKTRKPDYDTVYPWHRLISERIVAIDEKVLREDLHFVVHTI